MKEWIEKLKKMNTENPFLDLFNNRLELFITNQLLYYKPNYNDEMIKWAEQYDTLQDAWNVCERGDWMGWLLDNLSIDVKEKNLLINLNIELGSHFLDKNFLSAYPRWAVDIILNGTSKIMWSVLAVRAIKEKQNYYELTETHHYGSISRDNLKQYIEWGKTFALQLTANNAREVFPIISL